jgi:serralysin
VPAITLSQIYAGLHYADQSKWAGGLVTYSVPQPGGGSYWASSSYPAGDEPFNAAYGTLSADQRLAFIDAMELWDRVTALELLLVSDNAFGQGTIRIAFTNAADYTDSETTAAYAYSPPPVGQAPFDFEGDIWLDDEYKPEAFAQGSFIFGTVLHEIGHALGLKHPHEDAPLPAGFDNTRWTLMSYNDFADSRRRYFVEEDGGLSGYAYTVQPATPMVLDIAAIQGLYGAASVATGDNVYTIDEDFDWILTIVDSGGVDTIDLSDHVYASDIDLRPGEFSSVSYYSVAEQIADWTARFPNSAGFIRNFLERADTYTWSDNVATSLETVIENVRLGAANDTLNGNSASNSVSGGAGSDRIFGAAGADTIDGGAAGAAGNFLRGDDGADSIVGGADFDDAHGNMGNDTVSTGAGDDYCVGGKDNDLLFGGDGFDLVYGNLGDDTCHGEAGADIIRGGQGNDTLAGGLGDDFVSGDRGDDTMTGGAGADVFHSSMDAGIDRVLDFRVDDGDRVLLDPGTVFTVMQIGGDTVIQMAAGQVILVGVTASSLPPGTIFGT